MSENKEKYYYQIFDDYIQITLFYEYRSYISYNIGEEKDYIIFSYNKGLSSLISKYEIDIFAISYDFDDFIKQGYVRLFVSSDKDKKILLTKLKMVCNNLKEIYYG